MLSVDFHAHTFFSTCGIHTHIELLTRAKELGMRGLAITDHGPALDSRITWPFYDRLRAPVDGIRMIKGMECNCIDENGAIDLGKIPARFHSCLELLLLGLHPNIAKGQGSAVYTAMIIRAIEKNPGIDIIAHPNDPEYPLDVPLLARVARTHGVALELNNSKTLYSRTAPELTRALVRACKEAGCRMSVSSDTHAIGELGDDSAVRPYLAEQEFPSSLIVNETAERAFAFIEERRPNKQPPAAC